MVADKYGGGGLSTTAEAVGSVVASAVGSGVAVTGSGVAVTGSGVGTAVGSAVAALVDSGVGAGVASAVGVVLEAPAVAQQAHCLSSAAAMSFERFSGVGCWVVARKHARFVTATLVCTKVQSSRRQIYSTHACGKTLTPLLCKAMRLQIACMSRVYCRCQ